ncbi:MAG: right-handed parallel beta-helix repeat-containing protein [Burkholderiaceae bacterium]
MKITNTTPYKFKWVGIGLLLIGCGGGGGSGGSADVSDAGGGSTGGSSSKPLPGTALPDASQAVLDLPASVANGSTVELECGRLYRGTLNLSGKSNVSVKTNGSCGKAVITPGSEISGWTRHQGNIWVAPISFDVAQVIIDGRPATKAHWPSKSQTWATSTGTSANSLSYAMPNSDLAGATLVFQQYDWSIEARQISGYSGNTISFTSTGNSAYYNLAPTQQAVKFYVEGKLWMLDEADEWAVSNGKLYVWAADGQSPAGRIWASPSMPGIDAANSTGVSVDNVRIYGASDGIAAQGARNLRVTNSEIVNSSENGIFNTGGSGLVADGVAIRNTRHNAIYVRWGGGNEVIRNSTFDSTGVIGMPTNSNGAVTLTLSPGATVTNNTVSNSGYIGIRVFENSTVSGNTIDGSCKVMTDCGGVYASSENQKALNTRIENNIIRNTSPDKRLSWGVQLDDANTVTVAGNTFSGNGNGIILFNTSNVNISGNRFESSAQAHIQMAESRSNGVRNNSVTGNTFIAPAGEEMYRVSSDLGASSVSQFSSYGSNSYSSANSRFANFDGELVSFSQWKSRTSQDASSTYTGP